MEVIANNATLLSQPETYFGIYNELSKYNVHLNIFERLWAVSHDSCSWLCTPIHPMHRV